MSVPASKMSDDLPSVEEMIASVQAVVDNKLKPLTNKIDLEGYYPEEVVRELGALGAYRYHLPFVREDGECDMSAAIQAMSVVSHECLSTGFAMWCQDTCAWYLQNAGNEVVRDTWLPRIASGEVLAGTGMSNTMKAAAGIESLRLSGKKVDGGYIVNGALPWVSNLGDNHVFGTLFALEGSEGDTVMALVDCSVEGFELRQSAHFTALEGTRTFACIFQDVFIPDDMIIDHDGNAFLKRARAGMIMLQFGMGIGNIQSCIDLGAEVEPQLGHVNCYLEDRPDDLQDELDDAVEAALALVETPFELSSEYFREILQLRLAAGELAIRASQSAMMHTGAKGYLREAPAQRKLRESYFIAIVTPAIKHLRKELDEAA
jgi:alkylation response protein AidB-like acyl-CoA dehydrogenase